MSIFWAILIGITLLFLIWAVLWAVRVITLPKPDWRKCEECCWWFSDDGQVTTQAPLGSTAYIVWGLCPECSKRRNGQ